MNLPFVYIRIIRDDSRFVNGLFEKTLKNLLWPAVPWVRSPFRAEAHRPAVVIFYILHIYISEDLVLLTLIISEDWVKMGYSSLMYSEVFGVKLTNLY